MQRIVPCLWFDKEVKEATQYYVDVFPNSKINSIVTLNDTPAGSTDLVSFDILDYSFIAINGGPDFKFNTSISFIVTFDQKKDKDAKGELYSIWNKLLDGGEVLMPLEEYPFSESYGWVQDKFGVSWQLILLDGLPRIIPSLQFAGDVCGKAFDATEFYISIFDNSNRDSIYYYPVENNQNTESLIMFTDFYLDKLCFAANDNIENKDKKFNEAISLIINCENQEEIDYYWNKLSNDPGSEACGWLKDKYGLSWQVNPIVLDEMMVKGSKEQIDRLTKTILPMKKLDIIKLVDAFNGKIE